MIEENGCYFVALCIEAEDGGDEDVIFPVTFNTLDHQEALILVTCITAGDPRKRLMFADIDDPMRKYI